VLEIVSNNITKKGGNSAPLMEAKTNESVAKGERMSMIRRGGHASLIGGQLSKFVNSSSDTSVGVAELRGGGGTVRFCVDLPEQAKHYHIGTEEYNMDSYIRLASRQR
jgi:hypothetical protein